MIGAIIGDIVGSVYERHATKSTDFPLFVRGSRFTDDTVITVATAQAILDDVPYDVAYRTWGRRYPHAGYGSAFTNWLHDDAARAYGSWGNGSAMRVSPIAFAFDSESVVLAEAERSARVTHDHPEGIKGAQAVALAVFLARTGTPKADIRREIAGRFGYDLSRSIEVARQGYFFDVSCQGSVPEALICFLDTDTLEDAVRAAVSLGGDADTQASIAGAVAAAFESSVALALRTEALARLKDDLRSVIDRFEARYPIGAPRSA